MMRVFNEDGDAVPVTVVDVSDNRVTQVKTQAHDGYDALQVTFGSRRASRVVKPMAGHLAKAGVQAGEIIQEFRVASDVAAQYPAGTHVVPTAVFRRARKWTCKAPPSVKASPAPIKRHNFSSQPRVAR